MTRGNQREKAREKTMKKTQQASKAKKANDKDGNQGQSLKDRRERDAEIMRQKQVKKQEAAQASGGK